MYRSTVERTTRQGTGFTINRREQRQEGETRGGEIRYGTRFLYGQLYLASFHSYAAQAKGDSAPNHHLTINSASLTRFACIHVLLQICVQ